MSWVSLGRLNLSYDWQSFPTPALDTDTFRCLMPPGLAADGYVILDQYFAGDGQATTRRLYPFDDPKIIDLPIPKEFRAADQFVRYIRAKKSSRARVLSGQVWSLEIQAFY